MSEKPSNLDPERERYAFAITRKLFFYTIVGTALFAGLMVALWYIM